MYTVKSEKSDSDAAQSAAAAPIFSHHAYLGPSASLTSITSSGSVTSQCASSRSPSVGKVLLSESDSVIFQPGSSTKLQSLVVIDEAHRFCCVCLQKVLDSFTESGRLALNEKRSDSKRIDLNPITKYSVAQLIGL